MVNGEEKEKLHRLEDIKTKLFSRDYKSLRAMRSGILHRKNYDVPDNWQEEDKQEAPVQKLFMKTSMFKKFFIISVAFFILAATFAAYILFSGGNTVSNENIDIAVLGNTFTAGGEELPLQIEITNKNAAALELADLVVEYPKGSSSDLSQDTERLRDSLGTIPSGRVRTDNLKVTLFGEQGSVKPIKITLEYRVEGSNAIFVKEKDYAVSISSAPINLSVVAPDNISPNQNLTFVVKTTLNATKATSGLLLRADYPPGFQFKSASPSASIGNNVWNLGDLSPGAERNFTINGVMVGAEDGEEKTFHFFVGSQSDSDKSVVGVVFNSIGHTVLIKKPFIQARLLVNGVYQNEYATDAKNNITGQIDWTNNLTTELQDVTIVAKLSGNALDRRKIVPQNGFYNSADDTITWDRNSDPNFVKVEPSGSGSVSFSFSPLALFTSSGLISDPTINIDISISGKQPIEGNATNSLTDSESKTIKIISDVGFAAKALYYSGAFPNTGPIPAKVEQETTYTVVWSVSNTANSISNAQISSTLPALVRFVGPVSPASEDLKYNPSTKEIVWNIGTIAKGTGITGGNKEVSFQIAFTPSLSQVGTAPTIINDAILTGHDDFANVDVRVNKASLSTKLSGDPAFPNGAERVIE
jgi:hypothetical protein